MPTLKDTRSAEPVGRPQQATSPGIPRQSPSFDPATHQKLTRNIPCTEPPNPPSTSTQTSATLKSAKTLHQDSLDKEDKNEMTTKEIWINNPRMFNRVRNDLNKFIQSCTAYLDLNAEIYNSDKRKILFILSYMTKGMAEAWKEVFMDKKNGTYRSFSDFLEALKKAFSAADAEGEAQAQLWHLKQGKDT